MTAQHSPATSEARRLGTLERELKEEKDSRQAVWTFLWTLFVFKIATIGVIWYAAGGTGESQALIYATTWIWLIIPAGAIIGPILYWRRLRHQRKQRDRLIQSEWMVHGPDADTTNVSLVSIGDILPGPEPPKPA
jgi:hypothetical protein